MKKQTLLTAVVSALAASAIVGGVTWAAIPGDGGVIQGCYDAGGNLKVVSAPPCPKGYTALAWSQQGPKGADGAPGKDGINGTNGTDGKDGNLALAGRSCPDGSLVTGFDSSGDLVCAAPGEPPPPPPPPPPGEVRVDPVLLTFRTQFGTISEAQDVILQNITESDVVFFFDVAGANPADFILGDGCRILPAGSSCRLPVQFAPSDLGGRTATIRVHLPTGEVRGVALIGESTV